ncbi:MAG TPA: CHASE domain-containing protein [Tepidisphaeraceae bacterium]|jgi:PAS domain S-box-containing protein
MLLLTFVVAMQVHRTGRQMELQQYRSSVDAAAKEIDDAIRDRIESYIGLLRGTAGLFAAVPDPDLNLKQFRAYVARLDLPHNYPGARGVGFAWHVPYGGEEAFEQKMRLEGPKDFRIRPEPIGDEEVYAIEFLEPEDEPNKHALGYNMFSDRTRRDAMERARDSCEPTASGKVTLVQEDFASSGSPKQSGFLVYVPVYKGGVDPGSLKERQANLFGFVFCPFRADDLLDHIADNATAKVDYTVYDGSEVAANHHLHHTGIVTGTSGGGSPAAIKPAVLNIAGQSWTIAFRPKPELAPRPSYTGPVIVALVGMTFAFTLFLVMSAQVGARATAEQIAAELQRAQAALQQSEASLRRLVESNLIGVVIGGGADGGIIQANDAFLTLTGYDRTDLSAGKLTWAAIAPDAMPPAATDTPIEREYVRKDGSRVPVLVGSTPFGAGSQANVSFVVDLSELRKAQQAMAESERRFRTLVEQSPLGIEIFAPDGHVLLANHAWEEIWSSSLSQLGGYNVLFDQQLDRIGLRPYLLRAFGGDAAEIPPFRYDPALSGRPGRPRWIHPYFYPVKDQAGQVREIVMIVQDVTQVKEAEEALQRNEEQLRLVIDALPVVVAYIDQEKKYRIGNQVFEEWFGKPLAEVEGKPVLEVAGEEVYREVEPHLDRALSGERAEYDRRMRFPDGAEHELHVTLIPHVGLAGHVEGTVALVTDVTERRAAENERARLLTAEKEARADAELANRTKDEFLATLSHELRTPLNAILGWSQILRMAGLPPDEVNHGLQTIERNAKLQAQLVEDLLDLSRITAGKLRLETRPVDLPIVLDAALDSVRPAAEAKGIRLIPLLDAAASPVLGDAGRLQQVAWNLLSNAIKFTPSGGTVELILQRIGGRAEIVVSDTGVGIKPDFLPHVFERLRQADASTTRQHGGLGLGLAIARHLIESHGGTIEARSAGENRGATFIVTLPLSLNAAVKVADLDSADSDTKLRMARRRLDGVRVLVVDDEPDALDLVSRTLKQDGADVRLAGSAAEALGAIDELNPDVLISDIAMPGQDGYELIRQLRSRERRARGGRHVPAVALTAFARKEDRERALRAGYQAHLAKPVEPARLAAVVAQLAHHEKPAT